jgi:hypothetical protein
MVKMIPTHSPLWLCAESTSLSETGNQRGLYLRANLEVQYITIKAAFSTDRVQKADGALVSHAVPPPLRRVTSRALAVPPRSPGVSSYYYRHHR